MTTITYKNGILAADSRLVQGTAIVSEEFCKIIRLPCGAIAAGAGYPTVVNEFVKSRDFKLLEDQDGYHTTCMILEKDRLLVCERKGIIEIPKTSHFATGSGGYIANSWMKYGYSAIQAILMAAATDSSTNKNLRYAAYGSPYIHEYDGR